MFFKNLICVSFSLITSAFVHGHDSAWYMNIGMWKVDIIIQFKKYVLNQVIKFSLISYCINIM